MTPTRLNIASMRWLKKMSPTLCRVGGMNLIGAFGKMSRVIRSELEALIGHDADQIEHRVHEVAEENVAHLVPSRRHELDRSLRKNVSRHPIGAGGSDWS